MDGIVDGDRLTGVAISEVHGMPGDYEFLIHTADGREISTAVSAAELIDLADEIDRVGSATWRSNIAGLSFSRALELVRKGYRLRRSGWNGKGMFIFLVNGSNFKVNREPLLSMLGEGTEVTYQPHIDLKTADGSIVPWLASQSDILADDWGIAPL